MADDPAPPTQPATTAAWRSWMAGVAREALEQRGRELGWELRRLLVSSAQLCDDDLRRAGLVGGDVDPGWCAWAEGIVRWTASGEPETQRWLVTSHRSPWHRPWTVALYPVGRAPYGDLFAPPPVAVAS